MTAIARVRVRSPRPGEGAALAALWRGLWDAHERWGGYPGTRDPRVYAQIAARLDHDARLRAGDPVLGRHVHLVAEIGGRLAGQVEGWLDAAPEGTASTCEVRSLIVDDAGRGQGGGRALLTELAATARACAGYARCTLAAEVLEANPAHAFYARLGYVPVSWNARLEALSGAIAASSRIVARAASSRDALAIARLDGTLASRRRAVGDRRFERPAALDATRVAAIAAQIHPGATLPRDAVTLVACDEAGTVRATADLLVQSLEPPFLPIRRALLGRFALDAAQAARPLFAPLIALGCRLAAAHGAVHVELSDLSAPGTELHRAVLSSGAQAWSRIWIRPPGA